MVMLMKKPNPSTPGADEKVISQFGDGRYCIIIGKGRGGLLVAGNVQIPQLSDPTYPA